MPLSSFLYRNIGDKMTFSERFKQLRKDNELTLSALASGLKLNIRTVKRYESGEIDPSITTLAVIAEYFNVNTDYLLGISDNRERR